MFKCQTDKLIVIPSLHLLAIEWSGESRNYSKNIKAKYNIRKTPSRDKKWIKKAKVSSLTLDIFKANEIKSI